MNVKIIPPIRLTVAYLCLLVAGFSLLSGAIYQPIYFVGTALGLAAYIFVKEKFLRCPHCGGRLSLERLFFAKKKPCRCRHCQGVYTVGQLD